MISEDSDQTARMCRLISVFDGRTSLNVGFVVRWLILYQIVGAPSEDSKQSAHPHSLIRVFAVRMKMSFVLGYPQNALRIL